MKRTILQDGFIVLPDALDRAQLDAFRRDCIEPAVARWKAMMITPDVCEQTNAYYGVPWGEQMYGPTAASGYITDRMLRFATGRSYYELIPDALWAALRSSFGDLSYSVVAHCRQIHATKVDVWQGGSWSDPVPFHYDYWYHRESLFTLNVWAPFDPVGRDRPTLRLVSAPVRKFIAAYYPKDIPLEPVDVERRFDQFATLELDPGDVAIFTNWTPHQTYISEAMTKGRMSAEIRLCAADHVFHDVRKSFWNRLYNFAKSATA